MAKTPKWWRHIDRTPRETIAWFRSTRWIARQFKKHPEQWIPYGATHYYESETSA